jgi:hypothetical protein
MPELLRGTVAPTNADRPPGPPPRPKLLRAARRDDPARWASVVPPVLAEEISSSEAVKSHRALYKRVDAAATRVREARAAHARALQEDQAAEASFAAKGGKLPPAGAPAAAEAVAEAERQLEILTRQLPRSADAVFAAAYEHLESARERLEALLEEEDAGVEECVTEALRRLDERADLVRQQGWVGRALWSTGINPYSERGRAVSNSRTAVELRQALSTLEHERREAARRRHEQAVERTMLFHEDWSPRAPDGRSLQQRRAEAEEIVNRREREAAR